MRKILGIAFGFWLGGLLLASGADTLSLTDGSSVTGDVVKYDDNGILLRTPGDTYTNLTWTRFTQDALKQLSQNPKIRPFAEPFIITPPQRSQHPAITVHDVARLEQPPKTSVIGGMFSSSVGLVVLFLVYAANLFAAMEIAVFRARPIGLVMGVAAVLPIVGPIIFLSLPTLREAVAAPGGTAEAAPSTEATNMATSAPATGAPAEAAPEGAPTDASAAPASGIHLATSTWHAPPTAERPTAQVFQRGQFMFNRRFFETKFSGFFGMVRRESEKNLVLLVKAAHGHYDVQRITRIAANDVHFEIAHGAARQEVMVPFSEIQEVQLKPKES